jgi:3'(2'), 5'-bisphosphate nucleotidase
MSALADMDAVADRLGRIAVEAGRLLAAVGDRASGCRTKPDGSPTTAADLAAERLILSRLGEAWPGIPVVAEESAGAGPVGDLFFLVDPLDGTRDYLAGTGEYSVNLALVRGSRPVAAALAAPTTDTVWMAGTHVRRRSFDDGRPCAPVRARPVPAEGPVALVSRRHGDDRTEAVLSALAVSERRTVSSALKFALVASGEADVYVRCGPTMEWDTAAGDHLVTCAGGMVADETGRALSYGRAERGYLNGPFVALGSPVLAPLCRLT